MVRSERILVHPSVEAQHDALEAAARQRRQPEAAIWKSYQTAMWRLRADLQYGEVVKRSEVPAYFMIRYGVGNLYIVDLASFHRLAYTIDGHDAVLLDIMDHPTYDRLFGIRGK